MEFAEAIEKPRVNDVILQNDSSNILGSLALTSHHLIFQPLHQDNNKEQELWCKNFRKVVVEIKQPDAAVAVKKSIDRLSNLNNPELQYPFWWRCSWQLCEDGWKAFTMEDYFSRLQIMSDRWRLSRVNAGYEICSTYPEYTILPASVSDDVVKLAACFRQNGRFPVLSYYHKDTKSVLLRSSQPLCGPSNRRCREDEQLLNAYLSPVCRGYIIDTRTAAQLQAAKSKGGGCEQSMYYNQWKIMNLPIPRPAQLLDALSKHVEACQTSEVDKYLSRLAGAGWLQAVADVLTCAALTAQSLDREGESSEMSVLVHGSDGTDSTLMVTSLTQLILDSDTRTIRGFEDLISREWLSTGHPFFTRCAHSAFARGAGFEGPTFFCFLDCVYQLHQRFPFSFEFNDDFLVSIFEHAYASEFGTFLCDSEQERIKLELPTKTVSLWSYINRSDVLQKYLNPMYEPNNVPIWPCVAPQSIVLWESVFLRWNVDWTHRNVANEQIAATMSLERKLLSTVSKLRRQLAELEKEKRGMHDLNSISSIRVD